MDLEIRPIVDDEAEAFRAAVRLGFGQDTTPTPEAMEMFRAVFEPERTLAAFDDGDIVGTTAAFTKEVTVPGGAAVPMGGTTVVTVRATHRRRGLLTEMMRAHLAEVAGRGEPLAGLWASESSIYGRFGYGLASEAHTMTADGSKLDFVDDGPTQPVRLVDPDDPATRDAMRAVFERARATVPGMLSRTDGWWTARVFSDPPAEGTPPPARWVVTDGPDGVDGYARYRQTQQWDDFPAGTIGVDEMVTASDGAHLALWRYLTRIDLFPHVHVRHFPLDDPLRWRVTDPRRVVCRRSDALWLRLLDIPVALAARTYAVADRIVVGVTDPFLPGNDGAYSIDTTGDAAMCAPVDERPDVRLAVDDLAALYLGTQQAVVLARAGRAAGTMDDLARLDRMFAWPVAAWCNEVF